VVGVADGKETAHARAFAQENTTGRTQVMDSKEPLNKFIRTETFPQGLKPAMI
jgi:hypothetical protein